MSRGFRQFRYYGNNASSQPIATIASTIQNQNIAVYENNITLAELTYSHGGSGSICGKINGANINRIGIQSIPGCKFYLNGDADNAIYVGNSGIFELNFEGTGQTINDIYFDSAWVNSVFNNGVSTAYIILDLAYDTSKYSQQQIEEEEEDVF